MRVFGILALVTALTCNAQEPAPPPNNAPSQPAPANPQPSSVPAKQSVTVPQGTRIPLVLTTPINTRTTHAGDSVRAETAFPITISGQLVIPTGTYLEGQLTSVHRPNSSNRSAFQMRFTRLIFPSGYAVPLPGATAQARLAHPGSTSPAERPVASASDVYSRGQYQSYRLLTAKFSPSAEPQQSPPPPVLPPLPQVGPSRGAIIGASVGGIAAVLITTLVIAHHHQNQNDIYLDAGSQIELILEAPLTLDAESIAAASTT